MLSRLELRLPESELLFQLGGFYIVIEAVVHHAFFELLQVPANLGHEEGSDLLLRRLQAQWIRDPQLDIVGHLGIY